MSQHSLSWRVTRAKEAAERTLGTLPQNWEQQQREALAQQIFSATFGALTTKEAFLLKSLEIEEGKLRLKDKEVSLKMQALELAVKKFESTQKKAEKTLSNTRLSAEEKQAKLREIFGMNK